MISTILQWHQATPDTINHFAFNMMTLQHITLVLQHNVLCERGMRIRDSEGRDSGKTNESY